MQIKKLEIDSIGLDDAPNYGALTVKVGDRTIRVQLDANQIAGVIAVGEQLAAEIFDELRDAA